MAAKIRIMKLLQEIRGLADVTERHPTPRQPGLFLIELRSHLADTRQTWPRKTIVVEMPGRSDIPRPVKIKHVQTAKAVVAEPSGSDTAQLAISVTQPDSQPLA